MRKAFNLPRSEEVSTIGVALALTVALLAFGTSRGPSLAALMTTACDSSTETRCCACYTDDNGTFQCHGGAYVGASYCDSATSFCDRTSCRSPKRE